LSGEDLDEVCSGMELNWEQCQFFKKWFRQKMLELRERLISEGYSEGSPSRPRRKLSRWQLCVASRRAGKPFDPEEIRKLAAEYREGRCP
jgi:hypothetical protein